MPHHGTKSSKGVSIKLGMITVCPSVRFAEAKKGKSIVCSMDQPGTKERRKLVGIVERCLTKERRCILCNIRVVCMFMVVAVVKERNTRNRYRGVAAAEPEL